MARAERGSMRFRYIPAGVLIAMTAMMGAAAAQSPIFTEAPEHPAIGYRVLAVHDPVAVLNTKIGSGEIRLAYEGASGYLRSVLAALGVPVESQMAVFAKTSLQAPIIGPHNPRTIFFSDSVAVAWVPGEPFVEAAAQDPQQGVIFYTLNQRPAVQPQFVRADGCLNCHVAAASLGVPGMLLRSVFPAPDGKPQRTLGFYDPDDRSPLGERWGGWFVTGHLGELQHMGNTVYADPSDAGVHSRMEPKLDPRIYLTPHSDVVALMVFDHQVRLMNLLTRFGWQIRVVAYEKRAPDLEAAAREIVDYMLFVDAAPMGNPIQGTSGFAEAFAASGIRGAKGRSLRDFDLKHRLMRYPCSYMIYSAAFDGLPDEGRAAIYKLMWEVLLGRSKDSRYAKLSYSDREAVLEILRDTRKGLPEFFRSGQPAGAPKD